MDNWKCFEKKVKKAKKLNKLFWIDRTSKL